MIHIPLTQLHANVVANAIWLRGQAAPKTPIYHADKASSRPTTGFKDEVEERLALAGEKLGLDPISQHKEIENHLERIARRLSEEGRPFSEEVR